MRTSPLTKFFLFVLFTLVYIYFSYKALNAPRPKQYARNSNLTLQIIRKAEESLYDLYAIEEELAERRERLYRTCQDHEEANLPPNAWEFVIDAHHSLVWCNIFKSASSAWMRNFNLLGGYSEGELRQSKINPIQLLRDKFPRPTLTQLKAALQSSLSFIVVRDPLERLLSAYRDKVEACLRMPEERAHYQPLLKDILKVSDAHQPPPPASSTLSFRKFVTYITHTHHMDEHWAPIYRFCTPCAVNFTVIAKLDTMTQDQEYIIRKSGVEEILNPVKLRLQSLLHGKSQSKSLLKKYYSQLDVDLLQKLIDIYKIDFEMFGYDSNKYFDYLDH